MGLGCRGGGFGLGGGLNMMFAIAGVAILAVAILAYVILGVIPDEGDRDAE